MSLYKFFGFKENIFNTRPLLANKQDAEKFIGREEHIKSFMIDISTDDRALVLVTGQKGVGKTSFVNITPALFGCNISITKTAILIEEVGTPWEEAYAITESP